MSFENKRSTGKPDWDLGVRVKLARTQRLISQESLAAALGVTFQQVQRYEGGINRIPAVGLAKIAHHLGFPITHFLAAEAGTVLLTPPAISQGAMRLVAVHERLTPAQQRSLLAIARVLAGSGEPSNGARCTRTPDMFAGASA